MIADEYHANMQLQRIIEHSSLGKVWQQCRASGPRAYTAVHGQASSNDVMSPCAGWRTSVHVHTAIDIQHGVDGVGERTSQALAVCGEEVWSASGLVRR